MFIAWAGLFRTTKFSPGFQLLLDKVLESKNGVNDFRKSVGVSSAWLSGSGCGDVAWAWCAWMMVRRCHRCIKSVLSRSSLSMASVRPKPGRVSLGTASNCTGHATAQDSAAAYIQHDILRQRAYESRPGGCMRQCKEGQATPRARCPLGRYRLTITAGRRWQRHLTTDWSCA